jgi:hypothetical protein
MKGYHPLSRPDRRLAGHAVVALRHHDFGLCSFAVEDSSSYSGGRNISCKAGLESTERGRSRIAYMPVTIVVL